MWGGGRYWASWLIKIIDLQSGGGPLPIMYLDSL